MRKAAGVQGRPTMVTAEITPARIHSDPDIQPPKTNQRRFSRRLMTTPLFVRFGLSAISHPYLVFQGANT